MDFYLIPFDLGFDLTTGSSQIFLFSTSIDPNQEDQIESSIVSIQSNPAEEDVTSMNNVDTVATTINTEADLFIESVDVNPATAVAGESIDFVANINNNGPSTARDITLTIDFNPSEVAFVLGTNCILTGDSITCSNLADIEPSSTVSQLIRFDVLGSARNDITIDFTVTTTTQDNDPDNNLLSSSPTVDTQVDLVIAVSTLDLGHIPVAGQDQITYQFSVTNLGPSDAFNVVLDNTLDQGLTFVSDLSSMMCSPTGSCDLSTLAAGDNILVVVTADINPDTRTSVTHLASVSSDEPDTVSSNNALSETTLIDTIVEISVELTPPATLVAGTNLVYDVLVSNSGPSFGASVAVTLTHAHTEITFLSDSLSICVSTDPFTVECEIPTLDFTPVSFSITSSLDSSARNDISIAASIDSLDLNLDSGSDSFNIPVLIHVDLLFQTASIESPVIAGNTIDFSFAILNQGPSDAGSTVFTIPLSSAEFDTSTLDFSATSFACVFSADVLTCDLETLTSGNPAMVQSHSDASFLFKPLTIIFHSKMELSPFP